mmetsp:Transcript_53900/g.144369  ORF Transcript_53900/g.144369 Transcript_53900/m.144369 type:complete len:258 (+) Transcript_53900:450-1223(+)
MSRYLSSANCTFPSFNRSAAASFCALARSSTAAGSAGNAVSDVSRKCSEYSTSRPGAPRMPSAASLYIAGSLDVTTQRSPTRIEATASSASSHRAPEPATHVCSFGPCNKRLPSSTSRLVSATTIVTETRVPCSTRGPLPAPSSPPSLPTTSLRRALSCVAEMSCKTRFTGRCFRVPTTRSGGGSPAPAPGLLRRTSTGTCCSSSSRKTSRASHVSVLGPTPTPTGLGTEEGTSTQPCHIGAGPWGMGRLAGLGNKA